MSLDSKKRTTRTNPAATSRRRHKQAVTPEQRRRLISDLAYRKSEKRGSRPGDAMQDWLDAEAEVDRRLSAEAGNGRGVQGKSSRDRKGRGSA